MVQHTIDRHETQQLLEFSSVYENSLDAVSDRDYIIETLHNISLTMIHLSRFAEEIIFWSTDEAKFITLSDAFYRFIYYASEEESRYGRTYSW